MWITWLWECSTHGLLMLCFNWQLCIGFFLCVCVAVTCHFGVLSSKQTTSMTEWVAVGGEPWARVQKNTCFKCPKQGNILLLMMFLGIFCLLTWLKTSPCFRLLILVWTIYVELQTDHIGRNPGRTPCYLRKIVSVFSWVELNLFGQKFSTYKSRYTNALRYGGEGHSSLRNPKPLGVPPLLNINYWYTIF